MKNLLRIFLACAGVLAATLATPAEGALITHPSGPDTVSRDDVKNILLGIKTRWDSGPIVKLAILTSGPAHEAVVQEFTARSADQFDKYWKKQVFTGKGVAPESCKSDAVMIAYVGANPGAFGYVAAVPAGAPVKVLTVK